MLLLEGMPNVHSINWDRAQPTSMMDGSVDGKTENPSPEKGKKPRENPSAKVVKGENNSRGFVDWLEC